MKNKLFIIVLFFLCFLISCSKTTYTGQHNAAIFIADSDKIVFLDYTELTTSLGDEKLHSHLDYVEGYLADFDLGICSMKNRNEISKACIDRAMEHYGVDIVVVSWLTSCQEGDVFDVVPLDNYGVSNSAPAESHVGRVKFNVYRAGSSDEILSFDVATRKNGFSYDRDQRQDRVSMNFSSCRLAAKKAFAKGRKKLLKQIVVR